MFKHLLFLIILSALAIFLKHQLSFVLHGLLYLHNLVASGLAFVFSSDPAGQMIQAIIGLILIPLFAGLIAMLIFYFVKRDLMPHAMTTIWIVWTILLVTMLAQLG